LQYAIQLRSVYAIRIYELLKQYQRLKQRTLAVAELRRMLAMTSLSLIKDFRRRVIDTAAEINAKTDLCFEMTRSRPAVRSPLPLPHCRQCRSRRRRHRQPGTKPNWCYLEAQGDPAEAGRLTASYAPGGSLAPRRAAAAAEEPPPDR
jgi:hypothetical protein